MDDERIRELFEELGPISIRRLFGGKGIYHNGVIFALVLRGELMLKGDDRIAAEYEAAGCRRWTYIGRRHGKEVAMPYWSAPESALDDPDEMVLWARKAYEAGVRGERLSMSPESGNRFRDKDMRKIKVLKRAERI